MNNLRIRFCVLLMLIITISGLQASEPRIIRTDRGEYQLYEFEQLPPGSIELTEDGNYLLHDQLGKISCYKLSDLQQPIAQVQVPQPGNWKIVDSKMVVGMASGWYTYAIPSLEFEDSVNLAGPQTVPQSVDEGWLYFGLLYRPDAKKVIASMRGWSNGKWVDLSADLNRYQVPKSIELCGRELSLSPDMQNIGVFYSPSYSLWKSVGRIPSVVDYVEFNAGGLHLLGLDRVPYPLNEAIPPNDIRCGPRWISARVMKKGDNVDPCHMFVRVISMRGEGIARQIGRFNLTQPSLVLDSKSGFAQGTLLGDVPKDLHVVTWPRLRESVSATLGEKDESEVPPRLHWLFRDWMEFHRHYAQPDSLSALRAGLQKYIHPAKLEYEMAVGEPASKVPFPIHVGVKQGKRFHEYFVWTQISEDELVNSFGKEVLNSLVENEYRFESFKQNRELESHSIEIHAVERQQNAIVQANRQKQDEADFAATRWLVIVSTVGSLLFGCGGLVAMIVYRSRIAAIAAILFVVPLSSQAFGQGAWTIKEGDAVINGVTSLQFADGNHQIKVGFHSGMALLRSHTVKGKSTLGSIDLKTMKAIVQVEYPVAWDWDTTVVGGKFAASIRDNKLSVLDISTCKIIQVTEVPRSGELAIFFDKALWLEPNLWFALPSLKPVKQHAIIDPGNETRWLSGYNAPPYMVDANRCIIDGVEFDSNLKQTGNFFGHAQHLDSARSIVPLELTLKAIEPENEEQGKTKKTKRQLTWQLEGVLRNEDKSVVSIPTGKRLIAHAPKLFKSIQNPKLTFLPYQDGLWCQQENSLIVLNVQPEFKGLGMTKSILFPTPFVDESVTQVPIPAMQETKRFWDGPFEANIVNFSDYSNRFSGPYQSSETSLLKVENENIHVPKLTFFFSDPIDNNIGVWIPSELNRHIEQGLIIGQGILEQVVMLANAPGNASWDEVAKAYRMHCEHWVKFAPDELRSRPDLLPVELALRSTKFSPLLQDRLSVVIFFKEEKLKRLFENAHSFTANRAGLAFKSPDELSREIAQFENRDPTVVLPAKKELEPLSETGSLRASIPPPQQPTPVIPIMDPKGQPEFSVLIQAVALPFTAIVRGLLLLGALGSVNYKIPNPEDKVKFPGGWLGLCLLALTWVSLEYGLLTLCGALTIYLLGMGKLVMITSFCANILISLFLALGLISILSGGNDERMNNVMLRAFAVVAFMSLRQLLPALFMRF